MERKKKRAKKLLANRKAIVGLLAEIIIVDTTTFNFHPTQTKENTRADAGEGGKRLEDNWREKEGRGERREQLTLESS